MRIAYLDPVSGISGDMFLGCLVSAGWPLSRLEATVSALLSESAPESWKITTRTVQRGAITATLVDVRVAEEGQPHRHLHHVTEIIQASTLAEPIKVQAGAVFTRLAEAEAKVHGTTIEQVHFHEVGALDAIVDIVGVCVGLAELGVEQLWCGPLPLGGGWTKSAHGKIPLPAPATLELLTSAGAATRPAPGDGELVTPTGAALVATLAQGRWGQPPMQLEKLGTGTGQKEFAWPNIARLWIGTSGERGTMVQLETNIDNMNPELYGAVTERLFAAGAADVWLTPIQMKKGRPGVILSLLCRADLEEALADLLLRETSTLGVRVVPVRRHEAERMWKSVETAYGAVRVKLKILAGKVWGAVPEYEECRALAEAQGVPVRLVYEAAFAAGQEFLA